MLIKKGIVMFLPVSGTKGKGMRWQSSLSSLGGGERVELIKPQCQMLDIHNSSTSKEECHQVTFSRSEVSKNMNPGLLEKKMFDCVVILPSFLQPGLFSRERLHVKEKM